ncbi:MAG: DUF4332 domain-containing protein [Methyloligellaceae bacterium]
MSYPIDTIEGIGVKYKKILKSNGIASTGKLLDAGAKKKGRQDLAKQTGIEEKLILKWTNMADLLRVKGVGEEYSELLEVAGVDTVKELRKRKPENLHQAMTEANAKRKKKLVRQLPGLAQVEKWVKHAKELKPTMTY